ncbi:hypothetical protein FHX42_003594 [Saccharopolyspora lacisalsi]|uniref:Uncharacterized protein n=1 Tax=Halosaccharopolyspora lacisalsi TaxID=1000566 RepID=A0A839E5Q4_9PSEU|nr:hypothetical protein [Halosaccharopolyspora lacisalsi]
MYNRNRVAGSHTNRPGRTPDEALRARIVPLEAKFGRIAHQVTIELLGADDTDPVTHRLVQDTLDLARGLGLADVLTDDSARRERIVHQWAATLDEALSGRSTVDAVLDEPEAR